MSVSVLARWRRRRSARRKPKLCCAANRSPRRSLKEAAAIGSIGSEPDQRPAQQRRESPLDRRSIDPPRSGANLESRHRQGGSIMSLHDQHENQRPVRSAPARKLRRRCWNFSATRLEMKGSKTLLQHRRVRRLHDHLQRQADQFLRDHGRRRYRRRDHHHRRLGRRR